MSSRSKTLLLGVGLAGLCLGGGCGGLSPQRGKTLIEDVRGYNDGLRWRRPPQAAVRVPPRERDDFFDERAEVDEELRIANYEVARVRYYDDHQRAIVHVDWTWHLDSRGIVHETTTRQEWERHGKRWLMVEERRVRGQEMPGMAEPPEDGDEEGGEDAARAARRRAP